MSDIVKRHKDTLWRGCVFILVAWSGYNIGIISSRHGAKPAQEAELFQQRAAIVSPTIESSGQGTSVPKKASHSDDPRVVVSKASKSMKYHHPWCAGATQIKEANQLWFPTEQAAIDAGYTLAGNCTP